MIMQAEDPRTATIRDLKEEIQELQKDNTLVVIGGDFNDGDKTLGLHYMMSSEVGLHDAWELQNGPQTFRRGSECIDHVYMSHELKECVQSMEYLEYPSEFYTDHRPIQLKLNMRLLNKTHILIQKEKNRKIISNDYKNVEIYITERYRLYEHYKIEIKMKKLQQEINDEGELNKQRKEELIKKLDRLDDNLTTISLQAEKMIKRRSKFYKTRRIKELQVELTEIRYQIRRDKKEKNKVKSLNRDKQRIITEIRQMIKDQSIKVHQEKMERLNDMIQNGTEAAKKWAKQQRAQLTTNRLKKVYNKLSYFTGKRYQKEVMSVTVCEEGINRHIQDPDQIATEIMKHNKIHFSQANSEFFNKYDNKDILNSNQIASTYKPTENQEKSLIDIMKGIKIKDTEVAIEMETWKKKFKVWNERTRTSPSGVHLGHYKSLLKDIMDGDDKSMEINIAIKEMQEVMFEQQLQMVNTALKLGEPIKRWKRAINVAIPKQIGNLDISKFRNIHIYIN